MSTLKEKAQEVLNEKESKLSSGEFLNTEQIFGIDGTFNDERGNTLYAEEVPQVSDLPADASIEVISQVNSGDTVINPMTDIVSRVGYGAIAESIGLVPEVIKSGETVLGIDGNVEELMGDIAVITPSIEPQIIYPEPGYNAFTSVEVEAVDETIDPNIVPENIREGVSILGVDGNMQEGTDTSDATATADDIVSLKTAYVNGEKLTGSIYVPQTSYTYADTVRVSLTAANGVLFTGTAGTYNRTLIERGMSVQLVADKQDVLNTLGAVDTSDATADEYDLAMGKTAYAKGNKIIGAVPVYSNYTYTKMYPTVGSLAGNTLEILGTMGSHREDTVLLRPEARVKLTPLQSDIANAAGLTANKLKYGETVLGVVGTYQGGEIKTQIDCGDNTIIVHCGVIVNALTSAINEGKIDASYKIDFNTSGISTICLKLCDVAPNEVLINDTGTILTGCLGLAVNLESSYTALVFLAGDGEVEELGALDSHSSSPYYTTNMTVGDLIAALGSIGDVEIDISQDVIDSAWVYNEFRVIYYHFLNGSDLIERGLLETTSDSMEIGEV